MKTAASVVRVKLLQLLVARRAIDSVPALLDAAKDADAGVRGAALDAIGQLGGPELVATLARLILDAKDAATREKAERALAVIARRDPKDADPGMPLLKVMADMQEREATQLLPALGRIGGPSARKAVDAALFDFDPSRDFRIEPKSTSASEEALSASRTLRRVCGLLALCNWPDGSVAPRLVELVRAMDDSLRKDRTLVVAPTRKLVVDALIRVAPLPDKRSEVERLAMLKRAMELASSDEQRTLVLKRAAAIRSLETLRFVVPYLDQPKFTQMACLTVVELAHHKDLRQPNKAEFDTALNKVLTLSKDPEVILRANHYLKDETWVEKQIKGTDK
jgi:hypothetical protein